MFPAHPCRNMAPKRRTTKSQASSGLPEWAQLKETETQDIKNKETSLLGKEEELVAKKRRQLGRRRSEEQVERAISTHFGHLSKMELETTRIEGYTARERILADIQAAKRDGVAKRLGAVYWRQLRPTASAQRRHES